MKISAILKAAMANVAELCWDENSVRLTTREHTVCLWSNDQSVIASHGRRGEGWCSELHVSTTGYRPTSKASFCVGVGNLAVSALRASDVKREYDERCRRACDADHQAS